MSDYVLSGPSAAKSKRESRKLGFIFYEALYGPIVFARAIWRQSLILIAMFLSGAAIFAYYEHLPVLDAILASISTITTIGLYAPNHGNFATLNRQEALLLIIMIIVSVGAGASILQSTVGSIINGDLAKGQAEKKLISKLKRHVIVYGYSHLGQYIIEKLEEMGFDYVIIVKKPELYHELLKRDLLAVLELETQPIQALDAAGIGSASMVIVSHIDDPANMLVILSARKLRPDIKIVTVVHDSSLMNMAKSAGADVVIPSAVTLGHLLALSAVTKNIVGIVFSEKLGTKEIAEFTIFKSSPLIGKKIQEASRFATILTVIRAQEVVPDVFSSDFILKEDDTLLVLGDSSNLQSLADQARAT